MPIPPLLLRFLVAFEFATILSLKNAVKVTINKQKGNNASD